MRKVRVARGTCTAAESLLTPRPTGRYLLLTAAANQLRYPNSHSAYFSYLLLYLYGEGHEGDASTKEQITRVLLERLIVSSSAHGCGRCC